MRFKMFFLWLALLPSLWLKAQPIEPPHSTYGKLHSPRGDLHVLVIVIRYPDKSLMNDASWPDSSEPGALPRILQGEDNQMFCRTPDSLALRRYRNLSDYLYTMSGGEFRVTGEAYPRQVPVAYVPERGGNFYSRQQAMNEKVIRWITEHDPDFDWGRFDQRTNRPAYRRDNSQSRPDSILDYVLFLHRDFGSTGFSSACNIQVPGTPYRIKDGHTSNKNYASAKQNWLSFLHELAHNLYNAPHYGGANHSDGTRYYTQKGWGLMAPWTVPFFTPLAWESWWLGWLEAQEVTAPGRYVLGDLITQKDALRIRIPGTRQYLWLENHQKRDPWDQKLYYGNEEAPFSPTAPGLYAYTVAAMGSDRHAPYLRPFNKNHVNMIRMYNGEGNFDYTQVDTVIDHPRGKRFPVFAKVATNPIMGQNDFQFIRQDYDGDGRISVSARHGTLDGTKQEDEEVWNEVREGQLQHKGNASGDAQDALTVGDEIGLSGKFPVFNYPRYQRRSQQLQPLEINGLRIEVVSQKANGSLVLDIDTADWSLRRDIRWCGPLRLSDATGTQELVVEKGVHLTLDLGGTPDRITPHPTTGTFTNPTVLTLAGGRTLRLRRGATLTVQAHSRLQLQARAQLVLERGSTLRVVGGGRLQLQGDSRLRIEKGAQVIIEPDGQYQAATPANLDSPPRRLKQR